MTKERSSIVKMTWNIFELMTIYGMRVNWRCIITSHFDFVTTTDPSKFNILQFTLSFLWQLVFVSNRWWGKGKCMVICVCIGLKKYWNGHRIHEKHWGWFFSHCWKMSLRHFKTQKRIVSGGLIDSELQFIWTTNMKLMEEILTVMLGVHGQSVPIREEFQYFFKCRMSWFE